MTLNNIESSAFIEKVKSLDKFIHENNTNKQAIKEYLNKISNSDPNFYKYFCTIYNICWQAKYETKLNCYLQIDKEDEECNSIEKVFSKSKMIYAPKIIGFIARKNARKIDFNYPSEFEVQIEDQNYKYKLIFCYQYIGNGQSGHYTTTILGEDNYLYLRDMNTTYKSIKPIGEIKEILSTFATYELVEKK